MSGENAAKGMPGYRKTLTGGFYPELYNTGPPAPPDAGLPWKVGAETSNPLSDDPPNPAPPSPDRGIQDVTSCKQCGTSSFSRTDAAACPNCGEMQQAVTPTYTPGTPWF
jgi:hypothetical protein